MRPKKDIAKDQMDMAPYRKGGRTRRYAEGGDIENYEDAPAPKVERIGKSALEEGEEEFQRVLAQRGRRASRPATRAAAPARTSVRDAGIVPVGEDELAVKSDERPQARQPSKLERMVAALPVGKIGAGLGAVAGAAGTAYAGYKAAQRLKAAKQMRDAELMRQYKGAEAINRDRMGAAADALKRERRSSSPSLLRSQENFSSGGSVSSASSRADGIAQKGKTKGKVI